ncbi:MAG: hypothetical protein IT581_02770 [Verrucomicrobiales bacterium]|nr:hypothetical protein [Verrucomicrobiales bacterium]
MRPSRQPFSIRAAILILCVCVNQSLWPSDGRRVIVTTTSDSGPGSLREAIEKLNAEGDGEIDLGSVSGAIRLESALPELRRNLRLLGPLTPEAALQIDGQGKSAILAVCSGATCEVARLVLTRGFAEKERQGAAIANAGTLVLRECELSEHRTLGGRGGAIFNQGDLQVFGGIIQSNVVEGLAAATSGTGPGDATGGAVYQESGFFAATGTLFAFNSAIGGLGNSGFEAPLAGHAAGGAIFAEAGRLRILRCRMEGNTVTGGAGGSSEFRAGNGGLGRGGALYVHLAEVEMGDCEFRSNRAVGGAGGGATNGSTGEATGNGGVGAGAVVFNEAGTVVMSRCHIVSNTCRGGPGSNGKNGGNGADALGAALYQQDGAVEIRQSLIHDNRAWGGAQGGGFRGMGAPGSAWGGAMVARGGRLLIENTTLSGNGVQGADAHDSSLVGSPGPAPGSAGGGALAVGAFGAFASTQNPQVSLRFLTVTRNRAIPSLTYVQKPFAIPMTLTNGLAMGGGIMASNGVVEMEGVICANNIAVTNADVSGTVVSRLSNLIGVPGSAAGLADHDLVGVDPRLSLLDDHGGPTWTYALLPGSPALDVIRSGPLPSEDQRGARRPSGSGWDLGAFEADPRATHLEVVTSDSDSGTGSLREAITKLNAEGDGEIDLRSVSGVIHLESALPTVARSVRLVGPDAGASVLRIDGQGQWPILAFAAGTTGEVLRLTLTNAYGSGGRDGAAISNAGSWRLVGCELSGNRTFGGRGGAIFNRGDLFLADSVISSNTVEGLPFFRNGNVPGAGLGGAVYHESGRISVTNTLLEFNRAVGGMGEITLETAASGDGWGGAIYAVTGRVELSNCRLLQNTAAGQEGSHNEGAAGHGGNGRGGAVYSQAAELSFQSSEFRSNRATGGAGIGPSNVSLGSTIANGGLGEGGALFAASGIVEVAGCLVVSNVSAGGAGSSGKNGGSGSRGAGGAFVVGGGKALIHESLFNGNQALGGAQGGGFRGTGSPGSAMAGAVYSGGTDLTIENCTFSGNLCRGADGYDGSLVGAPGPQPTYSIGGGLVVSSSGIVPSTNLPPSRVRFSTFTENQAVPSVMTIQKPFFPMSVVTNGWAQAGGISNDNRPLTLEGVICAGNFASTNTDLEGTFASGQPNLIGDLGSASGFTSADWIGVDPRLGPLQDNGGPTWTHALLPGSPALDAIRASEVPGVDQRGVKRPMGEGWDLGAFEAGPRILNLRVETDGTGWIGVPTTVAADAVLEYSRDLRSWTPLGTAVEAGVFRDPTQRAAAYYRLRLSGP